MVTLVTIICLSTVTVKSTVKPHYNSHCLICHLAQHHFSASQNFQFLPFILNLPQHKTKLFITPNYGFSKGVIKMIITGILYFRTDPDRTSLYHKWLRIIIHVHELFHFKDYYCTHEASLIVMAYLIPMH